MPRPRASPSAGPRSQPPSDPPARSTVMTGGAAALALGRGRIDTGALSIPAPAKRALVVLLASKSVSW